VITIEATATVTLEGKVTIQLPATVPPGNHKLVLVIDEQPVSPEQRTPFDFPVHDAGAWPETLSLRREDMYDDWGR